MAGLSPYFASLISGEIPIPAKLFAPNIRRFAVIRLNPVAMVQGSNSDLEALAEARAMQTKKYLVFLLNVSTSCLALSTGVVT